MKTIRYPPRSAWEFLSSRPVMDKSILDRTVREIIGLVKKDGDMALLKLSEKYDGFVSGRLEVNDREITEAVIKIPGEIKKAIDIAVQNITQFHSQSINIPEILETSAGVRCWVRQTAIEKVGLYVPGGKTPLFSTVLMLAIPAKIAGCREIIVCTPPGANGEIDPLTLYAASVSGVTKIFRAGGAQAIAAMAYGTATIPRVYKIFGPGNQYVTRAKEIVQADGVAIDLPAGPSEVLIIADRYANPDFIASDLLSQAEHGPDSQVILVTDDSLIIEKVKSCLTSQVNEAERKTIIENALGKSSMILLQSLSDCISFSNTYAPEHLILATENPLALAERVTSAGSVFIGKYSCESLGDYATGPNHTLPTNGSAISYSGVSTESFMKKIFFQEVTGEGLAILGPAVELLAKAEKLDRHSNSVNIRIKELKHVRN